MSRVLEDAPWHPAYRGRDRADDYDADYDSDFDDDAADFDDGERYGRSTRYPPDLPDTEFPEGGNGTAPPRRRWWNRLLGGTRTPWWWASRGLAATLFVFILVVGWLAVTAPLSKSLEPIAAPQITLLASDGTPIARNGAVVDAPVDIRLGQDGEFSIQPADAPD